MKSDNAPSSLASVACLLAKTAEDFFSFKSLILFFLLTPQRTEEQGDGRWSSFLVFVCGVPDFVGLDFFCQLNL